MTLSRSQIAVVHVARRDLHLQDDDYRAILKRCGGVDSAADLDRHGFESTMRHFSQLGFKSTWVKRTFGERRGMAAPAQVKLIFGLWEKFHGPDENAAALNAWLRHFHKVDAVRFISAEKASPVINALKAMSGRATK